VGLTSSATMVALGASSCSRASRFGTSSALYVTSGRGSRVELWPCCNTQHFLRGSRAGARISAQAERTLTLLNDSQNFKPRPPSGAFSLLAARHATGRPWVLAGRALTNRATPRLLRGPVRNRAVFRMFALHVVTVGRVPTESGRRKKSCCANKRGVDKASIGAVGGRLDRACRTSGAD
jgi:hypothetical protein